MARPTPIAIVPPPHGPPSNHITLGTTGHGVATGQPVIHDGEKPRWVFGRSRLITDIYDIPKEALGHEGGFGMARRATHRETKETFAVKMIWKWPPRLKDVYPRGWLEELKNEVDIMRSVDHPYVVKFKECFEDDRFLYIVMELCEGGELYDRIKSITKYSEVDAARVAKMMFEAVHYLHTKGIAHCDLKPDNFLFKTKEDTVLKVIDFGMSKHARSRPEKYHSKPSGTVFYMAPEVIERKYYDACDMWSLGVTLYVMLIGFPPFWANKEVHKSKTNDIIKVLISKGFDPTVRPNYGSWFPDQRPISAEARDLIARLLERDPAKRLTSAEALEHPWITKENTAEPLSPIVLSSLRTYDAHSKFQQIVLRMMTDSLNKMDIISLQRTFAAIDTNRDGVITLKEMKEAVNKPHWINATMEQKEIERMMISADLDGDGFISYEEILLACVHRKLCSSEERLYSAFKRIDDNGDGRLSKSEIQGALARMVGEGGATPIVAKLDGVIAEVDVNGDGVIDYKEFLALWGELNLELGSVTSPSAAAIARAESFNTLHQTLTASSSAAASSAAPMVLQTVVPSSQPHQPVLGLASSTVDAAPAPAVVARSQPHQHHQQTVASSSSSSAATSAQSSQSLASLSSLLQLSSPLPAGAMGATVAAMAAISMNGPSSSPSSSTVTLTSSLPSSTSAISLADAEAAAPVPMAMPSSTDVSLTSTSSTGEPLPKRQRESTLVDAAPRS